MTVFLLPVGTSPSHPVAWRRDPGAACRRWWLAGVISTAPFPPQPLPDLLRSGALVGRVDFVSLALGAFDVSPLGAGSA